MKVLAYIHNNSFRESVVKDDPLNSSGGNNGGGRHTLIKNMPKRFTFAK